MLQPRNISTPPVQVQVLEEFPGGSRTVQSLSATGGKTLYLLGARAALPAAARSATDSAQLHGLAAVVGWSGALPTQLTHVEMVRGSLLSVPGSSLRLVTDATVTLSVKTKATEQYILRVHDAITPTMVTATLPWSTPPTQVNVWRGAHVWHVANTTLNSGVAEPAVVFEALPGEDYIIERQCVRSMKAGYGDGKGGWLCNPAHPF